MENDFDFNLTDGKLNISLNLMGKFEMFFQNFQIGFYNVDGNIENIKNPDDPKKEKQSRAKLDSAIKHVNKYLDKELLENGYEICEYGPNVALSLFYGIRSTVKLALKDEKILFSETTYLRNGFTGLLNQLFGTGMVVDDALKHASRLSDEKLMKCICEHINLKARRVKLKRRNS